MQRANKQLGFLRLQPCNPTGPGSACRVTIASDVYDSCIKYQSTSFQLDSWNYP